MQMPLSQTFQVYYEENASGTYLPLTDSCATAGLCFADIPNLSDGTPLATQLLTPIQSTFVPCGVIESKAGRCMSRCLLDQKRNVKSECRLRVGLPIFTDLSTSIAAGGGGAFNNYPEAGVPTITR